MSYDPDKCPRFVYVMPPPKVSPEGTAVPQPVRPSRAERRRQERKKLCHPCRLERGHEPPCLPALGKGRRAA